MLLSAAILFVLLQSLPLDTIIASVVPLGRNYIVRSLYKLALYAILLKVVLDYKLREKVEGYFSKEDTYSTKNTYDSAEEELSPAVYSTIL